jgi:predicted DNA-binding transcriptional regulator AlpA
VAKNLMTDADPVLTAKEVAEELRCSKSQVYRLMSGHVEGVTVLPDLALGRKKVALRSMLE